MAGQCRWSSKGVHMLEGIRHLRGVAALLVVIFHATEMQRIGGMPAGWPSQALAAGVDVFFVLSGFLMVRTTKPGASASDFLRRRAERILPMYWLLTVSLAVPLLLKPSLSERSIDLATILSSLVFLPSYLGPNTLQTTVIPVGWTLVYEAFFYALFAAGIALKVGSRGVIAVIVVLALLHPLTTGFYAQQYTSPLLLEFALGALIADLQPPTNRHSAVGLAVVGLFLLLIGAHYGLTTQFRPLACGPGAAATVYACTAIGWPHQRILALLGDASYSVYLFHLYPMKYIGLKVLHSTNLLLLVILGIVGGVLLYLLVERPLQRLVKRWNWGRGRVHTAVSV